MSRWLAGTRAKRLAVYGTGESAEYLIELLRRHGHEPCAAVHAAPDRDRFVGLPLVRTSDFDGSGCELIVASTQPAEKLGSLKSALEATGATVVLIDELLSDGNADWLKFMDILPASLSRILYTRFSAEYWDDGGTRWASRSHQPGALKPQNAALHRDIEALRPTSLLEVGCGTGRMLEPLRSNLPWLGRIVGSDRSVKMLARAANQMPGTPFVLADAPQLPFLSGSFDAVVMVAVAQHMPPEIVERALAELARVSLLHIIHWEYRWPEPGMHTFDHDLRTWYRARGMKIVDLDPGEANCFPKEPGRCQYFRVERGGS